MVQGAVVAITFAKALHKDLRGLQSGFEDLRLRPRVWIAGEIEQ